MPVDQVMTKEKWAFGADVTAVFDDMLSRSIPGYETMRKLCTALAVRFAQDNTWIVDLGCSRGESFRAIIRERGALNRYLGVEVSEPMIDAAKEALAGYVQTGMVEIRNIDLREKYPPMKASVTQAILTLQFIPIEYRQSILQQAYASLLPGGAFILVEKVLGDSASAQRMFVSEYLALKRENGYTQDQIDAKRVSLEGVLVPLTAKMNEELLRSAGFQQIDCFWRHLNFVGWLAVK